MANKKTKRSSKANSAAGKKAGASKQAAQLDSLISSLDTLPQDFEAPHASLVYRAAAAENTLAPVRTGSVFRGWRLRRTVFIGAAMACSAAAFLTFGLNSGIISGTGSSSNQNSLALPSAQSLQASPDGGVVDTSSAPVTVAKQGAKVGQGATLAAFSSKKKAKPSKHAVKKNPKLTIVMSASQSLGSGISNQSPKAGSSSAMSSIAGDMMIRCMGIYGGYCGSVITKYQPAASLSSKAGTGHVYQLVSNQDPKQLGTNLTKIFGLTDTVHSWTDQYSGTTNYYVGNDPTSQDAWTTPGAVIYTSGNSNYWYYYNTQAAVNPQCVPVDATLGDAGGCTYQPSGASKAPTQDLAFAAAAKMFGQLGYQTTTSLKNAKDNQILLSYQADDWGTTVSGNLIVAGQPTTISWYIYWNAITGQVVNMSGIDSIAKDAGLFDLLSPTAATDRLSTWQWGGSFYTPNDFNWGNDRPQPNYLPLCSQVMPQPVPVDPTVSTGTSVSGDVKVDPAPVDPIPCTETPTTNLISITSSQNTLMQVFDANQTIWLVPGYLYFDEYGYVQNALALPDGIIKLPENPPIVMY